MSRRDECWKRIEPVLESFGIKHPTPEFKKALLDMIEDIAAESYQEGCAFEAGVDR